MGYKGRYIGFGVFLGSFSSATITSDSPQFELVTSDLSPFTYCSTLKLFHQVFREPVFLITEGAVPVIGMFKLNYKQTRRFQQFNLFLSRKY
jgi:hypothetical protein